MKLIVRLFLFLFINLLLLSIFAKESAHKSHKKSHTHSKKKHHKVLPVTPKAEQLDNTYGGNSYENVYGPGPSLTEKEAYIKNEDGNIVNKHIRLVKGASNTCDITKVANYNICLRLSGNCDLCTASPFCGWCEQSQTCLPGYMHKSACPNSCAMGWQFGSESCLNLVRSGSMTNMESTAEEIITPEITQPKLRVRTQITQPQVVKTPVLLGTQSEVHELTKTNAIGETMGNSTVNVKKPIYGTIHQVLNYIDLKTGKLIPTGHDQSFHGTDFYNVIGD